MNIKKQVSKKRNIFGWCQWSISSTAVSPFFRVSFKKVCTNLLKKKGLKVYYFIAKSIKEVDEICDAQLYIASKMAFCWYYTHRYLGKTFLLNPYAVQGHESRHYTGLRKLLFYHPYFSTHRAFDRLCLGIPYTYLQNH